VASRSDRSGDGRDRARRRSCLEMGAALTALAARAVVGTAGEVWTANSAFCSLVGLDEPALRHLGWRQLVHSADRQYVAAHLVEVLAGTADLREFDLRLVPPDGRDVPARVRVELVRDSDGRQGWFLMEAWAST
jgi:PAS domain S-box-containing protein